MIGIDDVWNFLNLIIGLRLTPASPLRVCVLHRQPFSGRHTSVARPAAAAEAEWRVYL
jgi:hypothetical protein